MFQTSPSGAFQDLGTQHHPRHCWVGARHTDGFDGHRQPVLPGKCRRCRPGDHLFAPGNVQVIVADVVQVMSQHVRVLWRVLWYIPAPERKGSPGWNTLRYVCGSPARTPLKKAQYIYIICYIYNILYDTLGSFSEVQIQGRRNRPHPFGLTGAGPHDPINPARSSYGSPKPNVGTQPSSVIHSYR